MTTPSLEIIFHFKGNIQGHRKTMIRLYVAACLVTGAFTLLPGRLMHTLLFG